MKHSENYGPEDLSMNKTVCIICAESRPEKMDRKYPHLCRKHKKQLDREASA